DPSSPRTASKRKSQTWDDDGSDNDASVAKRQKVERRDSTDAHFSDESLLTLNQDPLDRARDEIRHQFGLEILLKHDELRLINQELAKCQVALEQLRRCSLIPYPINCPTPEQMLNVTNGKGPALASFPGEPVPKWAPPFGVIDGPYARHYAKWLIPDPAFDGIQPEWNLPEYARGRGSTADGRSTRNSFTETTVGVKGRPARANAGQKLHALSSGYPQPKDKAGPCVLKRADGQTVKLVCLDCHRENFSSTQGFINHCRIAHKRDFKSHEEAAVHSGQPLDSADAPPAPAPVPAPASEDKAAVAAATAAAANAASVAAGIAPPSTLVHPFARQDMTNQQAYAALRSRITDSLKLYHQGKLPGVTSIPTAASQKPASRGRPKKSNFSGSVSAPNLSQFMKKHNFNGDLHNIVEDAKIKVSMDDVMSDQESDDEDSNNTTPQAHTPVVMRTPAKSSNTPGVAGSAARPASSKGRGQTLFVSPVNGQESSAAVSDDEDMNDANFSPSTVISNNAPSLVSDDGEYDDSDEGSSLSEASEGSVSDVAEITLEEEPDTRSLRRGSGPTTVRLRRNEAKHVTFMSPVRKTSKRGRPRKA
ncbi:hypothetical protein Golomagni_06050, partial [Golovinomyces magnicellulatus]